MSISGRRTADVRQMKSTIVIFSEQLLMDIAQRTNQMRFGLCFLSPMMLGEMQRG